MDRQTLSNYGWIIITVLVLAVMLALATPFGTYVGDGVVSVANGFVGTSDNAIDEDNISKLQNKWDNKLNGNSSNGGSGNAGDSTPTEPTPEQPTEPEIPATFTFLLDGNTYTAEDGMTWEVWCNSVYNTDGYRVIGKEIVSVDDYEIESVFSLDLITADTKYAVVKPTEPETPSSTHKWEVPEGCTYTTKDGTVYNAGEFVRTTPISGDVFTDADYKYTHSGYWDVDVLDTTKTEYGTIFESINGQPVELMNYTFSGCSNLTVSPIIPNSVIQMYGTFEDCTSLKIAPVIPDSVTSMVYTFESCYTLTTAPVIPSNVSVVSFVFRFCYALTGDVEINTTPEHYTDLFWATQNPIKITGSCGNKSALAGTANNRNVTY